MTQFAARQPDSRSEALLAGLQKRLRRSRIGVWGAGLLSLPWTGEGVDEYLRENSLEGLYRQARHRADRAAVARFIHCLAERWLGRGNNVAETLRLLTEFQQGGGGGVSDQLLEQIGNRLRQAALRLEETGFQKENLGGEIGAAWARSLRDRPEGFGYGLLVLRRGEWLDQLDNSNLPWSVVQRAARSPAASREPLLWRMLSQTRDPDVLASLGQQAPPEKFDGVVARLAEAESWQLKELLGRARPEQLEALTEKTLRKLRQLPNHALRSLGRLLEQAPDPIGWPRPHRPGGGRSRKRPPTKPPTKRKGPRIG